MKQFFFRLGFGLSAALVLAGRARADDALPKPAPAWHLQDVNGNSVSSDQFKGKVVVLDFWATWCPPCVREVPGHIRLQKTYRGAGLEIVAVSLDLDDPGTVRRWVEKHGVNYTVVMGSWDMAAPYGVTDQIPVTIIVDRDGVMRVRLIGYEAPEKFEQRLLKYLHP
jgi:peroxiredoxin